MDQAFRDAITAGYTFNEPTLTIGSAMLDGELFNDVRVAVPLSILNRHGLVAAPPAPARPRPCSCSPASSRKPACRSSSPTSRAT